MIPEFDQNENLPVGFIRPTIGEFKERFVVEFDGSGTREDIFSMYLNYCKKMDYLEVAVEQWVDGSYITNKEDPSDIDLVTHIDALKVNKLTEIHEELTKLLDTTHCKSQYRCDVHVIPIYPKELSEEYRYYKIAEAYWSKWFGRDRAGKPKGIVEFSFLNDDFKFGGRENGGNIYD